MKLKIASIAFLLGCLAVGSTWLSFYPILIHALGAATKAGPPSTPSLGMLRFLPFFLAGQLALDVAVTYLLLYLSIGRPLRQLEVGIDGLGDLGRTGLFPPPARANVPLLSKIHSSLLRATDALRAQLSELGQVHQKLKQTQTELLAQDRLATVGKLAAGVAHEIGNPLSGVFGYLSLAKQKASSAELTDYLERIDAELSRIDQIVRGLLDLGRPPRTRKEQIALLPLVETCIRLVKASPEVTMVDVEARVDPALVAVADPGPLSQVLINLLLNAAQAVQAGGKSGSVEVRGEREGEWTKIEVLDDGIGISPEVFGHLFEPFVSTKLEGTGTGLGLAISHHLVQAMGGELSASNRPEGGASFTIRLRAT